MSITPSVAYNLQNHGTDYNLVTNSDGPSAGSSRAYVWQATNCGSGSASFLVDTLAQKCLWGSGSSVAVHDCVSTDQVWSIQEDDSVDTYTIQNVNGGNDGFLSLYEDRSFNLSSDSSSYAQWSFQSQTPPENVAWDVCDYMSGLTSSSSTGASSSVSSAPSTQVVTVTASSSLAVTSTGNTGSSDTVNTALNTSTLGEEQFLAEATAAATGESSIGVASGASTPTAATQTPSSSGLLQSNDASATKMAWCILLTALMVAVSATPS
ncbi:hypothetical protein E8E12_002672 [Didymella heteroderae]|uniref:Uncharacterized protein n=1 Tax=Didymella heteroderae TaxID=1769908 RepID=A0A9P4WNM8_9PLEO|nr:hypothetical protein E8E12_002672 [Didymella heteroderae]